MRLEGLFPYTHGPGCIPRERDVGCVALVVYMGMIIMIVCNTVRIVALYLVLSVWSERYWACGTCFCHLRGWDGAGEAAEDITEECHGD